MHLGHARTPPTPTPEPCRLMLRADPLILKRTRNVSKNSKAARFLTPCQKHGPKGAERRSERLRLTKTIYPSLIPLSLSHFFSRSWQEPY